MIIVRNVSKTYGRQRIIDNLSLTVPRGGLTALIGANGAGKSTLLTMISRLVPADSGTITVDGLDISKTPSAVLAQRLAILRQENSINTRLTVRDLVAFGRYPWSKGRLTMGDKEHIESALGYLELEPYQQRFLDELSGGQRQRAFIAMLLCQNTDYILLDEPLNNLDMKHSAAMMKLLRRAADELGKTIITILHDINFASCYADRIVALRAGRIIADDEPAKIMQRDCLRAIYDFDIAIEQIGKQRLALYYN